MKRRLFFALICIIAGLLSGAMAAESNHWTSSDDLYYHAAQRCGGVEGRVPISVSSALAFDKYACPVCVEYKEYEKGLSAISRGGTIVLRMTEEWIDADTREVTTDDYESPEGMDSDAALSEGLNGEALVKAIADLEQGSLPETCARVPHIYDGIYDATGADPRTTFIMNRRHINGCWYYCIRPDWKFGDECEVEWLVAEYGLQMKDGKLFWDWQGETQYESCMVQIEKASNAKAVFTAEMGSLTLEIFDEMDTHIAVIYEPGADKDLLEDVQLVIGGGAAVLEMSGYMDGESAVYCCVLSEGEYQAVKAGMPVEIVHADYTEGAEYYGGEFAIVTKGTGGMGIIDRNGEFVVGPGYQGVNPISPITSSDGRNTRVHGYFCKDGDALRVYKVDGDALVEVACHTNAGESLAYGVVNAAMYGLYSPLGSEEHGAEYYSLETGELLFTNKDLCTALETSGVYIDRSPVKLIEGTPQRLVAVRTGGLNMPDSPAWLVDMQGNIVTKAYSYIYPLIWKGDQGVYLVESFNATSYDVGRLVDFETAPGDFPYGVNCKNEAYGDNYRCGLIDQDGNVLADLEYTSFTIVSEDEIWMGRDGGFVIIELPWQ